jgi:hypothetical protein
MASETPDEMLSRVSQMADGDPTWDLSTNDQEALHHLLDDREKLRAVLLNVKIAEVYNKLRIGVIADGGASAASAEVTGLHQDGFRLWWKERCAALGLAEGPGLSLSQNMGSS